MKSNNGLREYGMNTDPEEVKKTVKLKPIKKSGKEKHTIYKDIDDDEDDLDLINYKKRESVLDYYDDGEEDYDDEYDDEDEDYYDEDGEDDYELEDEEEDEDYE